MKIRLACVVGLLAGVAWAGGAQAEDAAAFKAGTTLENLQAAFNGESNANAKYEAFAVKADAEGYGQVASLFRAAAKSEGIHAAHHAKQIKKLGAEPKADIKTPAAESTKQNLEVALKGENFERETMYPAYIAQAEKDKNKGALLSFKGATAAEAEHAKFYAAALANLESWKGGTKTFLVCLDCGYTTEDAAIKKCPVCAAPRREFVEVK